MPKTLQVKKHHSSGLGRPISRLAPFGEQFYLRESAAAGHLASREYMILFESTPHWERDQHAKLREKTSIRGWHVITEGTDRTAPHLANKHCIIVHSESDDLNKVSNTETTTHKAALDFLKWSNELEVVSEWLDRLKIRRPAGLFVAEWDEIIRRSRGTKDWENVMADMKGLRRHNSYARIHWMEEAKKDVRMLSPTPEPEAGPAANEVGYAFALPIEAPILEVQPAQPALPAHPAQPINIPAPVPAQALPFPPVQFAVLQHPLMPFRVRKIDALKFGGRRIITPRARYFADYIVDGGMRKKRRMIGAVAGYLDEPKWAIPDNA